MTSEKRRNFERLLNPRHIAFVGGADAAIAIGEARRAGFSGEMWVVNPKRVDLAGIRCVPDFSALPEAPDASFLAIPARQVPAAVNTLRQMGAGGIVCYSAGFSEAHEDGARLEAELKNALGNMVLIGPNCYGLINYIGKCALWPFAHGGISPGYGAAIITQSGMLSSDITMSARSLPLSYMASAGNQADLGLTEFVDLFCDRPEVRAIGLHIEGLSDIAAFERAALKSVRAGVPIVALKTGKSKIGESLTLSHTGSLAGSNELYEALFDRTGIISVTNPSQFLETLKFLCVSGAPEGRDIIGFTASGGGATMLADHAEEIGLRFTVPDEKAHGAIADLLPPIATVSNPLDYTTPIWGQPEKTEPVFKEAMRSVPAHTTVLVQDYPAQGLDETEQLYLNDALAFARAARSEGLAAAVIATIPENMPRHIRMDLIANKVSPMQGLHEALNAIHHATVWHAKRKAILENTPEPLLKLKAAEHGEMITEAEAKRHLKKAGLPIPQGFVGTESDLQTEVQDIHFPVALKMMSKKLAHKTEAGAVALDIQTSKALLNAVRDMQKKVSAYDPRVATDQYLVEEMAPKPIAELVVGLRRDPQFGACLTLGSGGVLVDLIEDTTSLLLPTHASDIEAALEKLKVSKLLDGYRGAEKADRSAIVSALLRLCTYAIENSDSIWEIEINPLFVYKDRVLAVDALLQVNTA